MIPTEIISLISEYDYELMCSLHNSQTQLIYPRICTYELAEYTAKHDDVSIFEYIIQHNNTLSEDIAEMENLFETAVMCNSAQIVEYVYKRYNQHFCADWVCYNIIHAIEHKYMDIVYCLLPYVDTNNLNGLLTAAIACNDTHLVEYIMNILSVENSYNNILYEKKRSRLREIYV